MGQGEFPWQASPRPVRARERELGGRLCSYQNQSIPIVGRDTADGKWGGATD